MKIRTLDFSSNFNNCGFGNLKKLQNSRTPTSPTIKRTIRNERKFNSETSVILFDIKLNYKIISILSQFRFIMTDLIYLTLTKDA
jgi:hypothetical protein